MPKTHDWLRMAAAGLLLAGAHPAHAQGRAPDDNLFPAAPAAKASIDFDGRGFMIHGQRTFLVSGSLHYARLPRAQWREMLLKFKRAGYNTVQTYVFWNWQEPREGQWDFTGDRDLDAFLKMVKQEGMYATVRVGPYVCAEWDSGGYPVWLRSKPNLVVRQDNPAFMAELTKYYNKILPIVVANQINKGGAVILLQMENEDKDAWGTSIPNSYFQKLHDIAVNAGVQVPFFFSGLHHAADPAGNRPWDSVGRTSPWYSTEFWAGWIARYGPSTPAQLREIERGDWKIIAYGGNGYNHYVLYGGTNFGTYNNDEDASNYDYGAAISQAGALRPLYYRDKRAAMFATSFPEILENSVNATAQYAGAATNAAIRVTARQSPAGTIVFLDNNGRSPAQTQVKGADGTLFPAAGPLTLAPGEIMPVLLNADIAPGVKVTTGAARVLGIARQGAVTTLVVYGDAGTPGQLGFGPPDGTATDLRLTFPAGGPEEHRVTVGGQVIRVLAVNTPEADRTWFVDAGAQKYVVVGPEYVGDVTAKGGQLVMNVESAQTSVLDDPAAGQVVVYGAGDAPVQTVLNTGTGQGSFTPLSGWQAQAADAEAAPHYGDAAWKASDTPLQMGADGDPSAYAWYRTTLTAPAAGPYTLHFADAGDQVNVFVDGQPAGQSRVKKRGATPVAVDVPVTLPQGAHTLAVLVAQYGRDKLYNYYGPIDQIAAKGLNGPVTLRPGAATDGRPLTAWRALLDSQGEADAARLAAATLDTSGGGWRDTPIGQDFFNTAAGTAWFRANLGADSAPHHTLHFESVDDNGTVYLNGQRLAHHEGWNAPFDVALDSAWNPAGPNVVAVLVQNVSGAGGLGGPVTLTTGAAPAGTPLTGWRMRGDMSAPNASGWSPLAAPAPGRPTYYKATFTYRVAPTGPHPVLRVTYTGLSAGFMSLNGHNLGRYPDVAPADSLYLPEAYLVPGTNTLTVLDEQGQSPTQIALAPDAEASHTSAVLALAAPPAGGHVASR